MHRVVTVVARCVVATVLSVVGAASVATAQVAGDANGSAPAPGAASAPTTAPTATTPGSTAAPAPTPPGSTAAPAATPATAPGSTTEPAASPVVSPADAEAHAAFERGVAALDAGRFAEAAEALEASYRARPDAVALDHLGRAYRGLGRTLDAVVTMERFLATVGEGGDPARRAAVVQEIARLRATLAELTVLTRPAYATLLVDGRVERFAAGGIALDPGEHDVTVSSEGFLTQQRRVTLEPGAHLALDVHLDVDPAAPVRTPPRRVVVGPGPITLLALGVVAFGAAAGLVVARDDAFGELRARCTRDAAGLVCPDTRANRDALDAASTLNTATNAAWIVGVVAAGAGGGWLLGEALRRAPGELRAGLVVHPGGASWSLAGAF